MRATIALLLAGVWMLAVGPGLAVCLADGASEAAPKDADKSKETKEGQATPSDKDLTEGLKDTVKKTEDAKEAQKEATADETKAEPDKPKRPPTPYERKLEEIEDLVAKAKEHREKLPALETKINEEVAKLTDSAKNPVEPKQLREELAANRLTRASKTYRNLNLSLAKEWEKVKVMLFQALKSCMALEKTRTNDEDLKVKGEALTASVKEQCVEVLLKLAEIYERISDEDSVTACYRQILAVDKDNAMARTYFKELEEKKKAAHSGGGSSYSSSGRKDSGGNTGRPSTGRGGY